MVDPDVLARRILVLSETLGELDRSGGADAGELRKNAMLRAAVERWLQLAIESCIDMAFHIVSEREWTPPDTAAGAFRALASHGLLDAQLAERLASAAGLRNVLVHDYVSVDVGLLARAVERDLDDLRAFGAMAAGLLGPE